MTHADTGAQLAFERIAFDLKRQIEDGVLGPGARTPSQGELMEIYGASSLTVQKAMRSLRDEGWVVSTPGRGTFVCGRDAESDAAVNPSEAVELGRSKMINVRLRLPNVGEIRGTWRLTREEKQAAWELYIELATRVGGVTIGDGGPLLREMLNSHYDVFGATRDVLRRSGPAVAPRVAPSELTFAVLVVEVLNGVLRPVIARWHPELAEYERSRPDGLCMAEHEQRWGRAEECRRDLLACTKALLDVAAVFGEAAGAGDLLADARARIDSLQVTTDT